jgi:hypothetical protein
LPALEIRDYAERAGHPLPALRQGADEEIEYEYVIEELDVSGPLSEETVDPDLVRETLARRRNS